MCKHGERVFGHAAIANVLGNLGRRLEGLETGLALDGLRGL